MSWKANSLFSWIMVVFRKVWLYLPPFSIAWTIMAWSCFLIWNLILHLQDIMLTHGWRRSIFYSQVLSFSIIVWMFRNERHLDTKQCWRSLLQNLDGHEIVLENNDLFNLKFSLSLEAKINLLFLLHTTLAFARNGNGEVWREFIP